MKYSQNNEEQVITDYFGDFIGKLLSIGENNGEFLSNTRALIEKGWSGSLVEPAPKAFMDLFGLHFHRDDIYCYNFAISDFNGNSKFFDSDTHLNNGDTSLLSSLLESEIEKWKPSTKFKEIEVKVIDFKTLLDISYFKTFDFINLDAEGNDLTILRQMDLNKLETKLICVEWNSKNKDEFDNIILPQGLHLIHSNAENLIYGR